MRQASVWMIVGTLREPGEPREEAMNHTVYVLLDQMPDPDFAAQVLLDGSPLEAERQPLVEVHSVSLARAGVRVPEGFA